jgi:hypothetical protein
MPKGFLTVSLSDAEPTWQGRRKGGPRARGQPRASSEVTDRASQGGTNSIFRLRYQIASYTGYIGNLAPSPKHETNSYY